MQLHEALEGLIDQLPDSWAAVDLRLEVKDPDHRERVVDALAMVGAGVAASGTPVGGFSVMLTLAHDEAGGIHRGALESVLRRLDHIGCRGDLSLVDCRATRPEEFKDWRRPAEHRPMQPLEETAPVEVAPGEWALRARAAA